MRLRPVPATLLAAAALCLCAASAPADPVTDLPATGASLHAIAKRPLGGDLAGALPNPTVVKINGATLGTMTPTAGNVPVGSGSQWASQPISGDGALGSSGALTVATSNGRKLPTVVASSGAAVTNTGIGTSEVNLVSKQIPAMGANDALEIVTLWQVTSNTNTKNLYVRFGGAGCTPLTVCTAGTLLESGTGTTVNQVSFSMLAMVQNANATNSQVFFPSIPYLISSSVAVGTAAVQTNAGGAWVNLDCQTATASTDSCALLGYTIKLVPGA